MGLVNLRDHLAKLGLQFKTVVAEDFLPEYNSSKTFAEEDFHRIFAVQNSGSGVYSTRVLQFKTFAAEDFFKEVLQFKVVVVENFLLECNSLMSSLITNGEQVFI